jgi:ferritin-like metal-binding protein YciE
MDSIRELLIDEMKDLYDAEKQLVKALPKMVKAASNPELSQAFESHLEQTRGHVQRLEQAFELMGEKAKSKPCEAMKGLIEEAGSQLEEDLDGAVLDSAIICAAQKVEHYEISGYGTLSTWAKSLGLDDVAALLDETLSEEKDADEKLTEIGGTVLSEAEASDDETETEDAQVTDNGVQKKGVAQKAAGGAGSKRRAG